jgi:hypothetical protein
MKHLELSYTDYSKAFRTISGFHKPARYKGGLPKTFLACHYPRSFLRPHRLRPQKINRFRSSSAAARKVVLRCRRPPTLLGQKSLPSNSNAAASGKKIAQEISDDEETRAVSGPTALVL